MIQNSPARTRVNRKRNFTYFTYFTYRARS
jgi:hypothetical protein